jgi:CRISPR-associated protein (TIGR03986 family)
MTTGNNKRFTHFNPTRPQRTARAPYNFVPLPQQIITVKQAELPQLNSYEAGTHTGWFDCELVTCSPTYVRGMMTRAQHDQYDPQEERKLTEAEEVNRKEERAGFYAPNLAQLIEGRPAPAIPGSSLRGLIRALIEIAGYGKMRWVNDSVKITFRAVAAPRKKEDPDPLAEPYREVIGQFSRNVLAGYLRQQPSGDWAIQPAFKPREKGWSERAAYLKVVEDNIEDDDITDFYFFNDTDYSSWYYQVSFNAVNENGQFGKYTRVTEIGDKQKGYKHSGVLVCTGNMVETNSGKASPRRNHALVLVPEPDPDHKKVLPIPRELLDAYRETLTPFQRDEVWPEGGIEEGSPVFYVTNPKSPKTVMWFGHTPNFRIPARKANGDVATLADFIPGSLRRNDEPDLAEAIFGWAEEVKAGNLTKHGDKPTQRAGRVSFTDARYVGNEHGVWYDNEKSTVPMPLSTPKITTFQHYLVQDKDEGHDPDLRGSLAHYGTATEIRGHKLYWHKGNADIPETSNDKFSESQLTRIRPVKAGVKFRFRVHFENLRDWELGALAWALILPPISAGQRYCHKLGMGKPLGMGAVSITAKLHLTERSQRYTRLFERDSFFAGANAADAKEFIGKFERFVFAEVTNCEKEGKTTFAELERIRMLLAMLQWREGQGKWLDVTRYQVIKREDVDEEDEDANEYKKRPVLPDPLAVSGEPLQSLRSTASPKTTRTANAIQSATEETGVVKKFGLGRSQSYGFIISDQHKDEVHVHVKDLSKELKRLEPGQRVIFKTRSGQKSREAYHVRLLKSKS